MNEDFKLSKIINIAEKFKINMIIYYYHIGSLKNVAIRSNHMNH